MPRNIVTKEIKMKTKELIRLLEKRGFQIIAANKHYKLFNGTITIVIPRHKETNRFTARDILKNAQITL